MYALLAGGWLWSRQTAEGGRSDEVQKAISSHAGSARVTAAPSQPRRIIGYYAGWTAKSKNFTPADIPADKLTHVNYAFGLIDEDGRAMLRTPRPTSGTPMSRPAPILAASAATSISSAC